MTGPGSEFAEQLRGLLVERSLSLRALARQVPVDAGQLSRVLNGKRGASAELARRCDEILGTRGRLLQAALADRDRRDTGSGGVVPRSLSWVGGRSGLVGFPGVSSWDVPVEWVPVEPTCVEQEHIDRVLMTARMFSSADHGVGGVDVAAVAGVQLGQVVGLFALACPAALRPELFTAVGWLSNVVAFAQFDAARHAQAATAFAFGLECAERAANWHLRAKSLSGLARDAIWRGDPDAGLTYVELALVRADRLTGTERAMLLTARARALARLGRVQDTIDSVRAADEQFFGRDVEADPPWMFYYDEAQHLGDTGHALYDLVAHGHCADEAMQRLRGAFAAHRPAFVRSRGMSGAKLATLAITTGDHDQAVAVAAGSLDLLGDVRSQRARSLVRDLADALDARPGNVTVEVRDRIDSMLSHAGDADAPNEATPSLRGADLP